MSAIERCRTAALGGHVPVWRSEAPKIRHDGPDLRRDAAAGGEVARCEDCNHAVISYNSCLMGKFRNGELLVVEALVWVYLNGISSKPPSFLSP